MGKCLEDAGGYTVPSLTNIYSLGQPYIDILPNLTVRSVPIFLHHKIYIYILKFSACPHYLLVYGAAPLAANKKS